MPAAEKLILLQDFWSEEGAYPKVHTRQVVAPCASQSGMGVTHAPPVSERVLPEPHEMHWEALTWVAQPCMGVTQNAPLLMATFPLTHAEQAFVDSYVAQPGISRKQSVGSDFPRPLVVSPSPHGRQVVAGPPMLYEPTPQMLQPVSVKDPYPAWQYWHFEVSVTEHLSQPFGMVAKVPVQAA